MIVNPITFVMVVLAKLMGMTPEFTRTATVGEATEIGKRAEPIVSLYSHAVLQLVQQASCALA